MKQSLYIYSYRCVKYHRMQKYRSHQLLIACRIYPSKYEWYLFLFAVGKKVLGKIEKIIREEMEAIDAVEVLMPAMQHAELWQESDRWYNYGPELFRLKDRHNREFALGATHEEVITSLVRDELKSYKQLTINDVSNSDEI